VESTSSLWRSVGCQIVELEPQVHDACMARVSHLPHAVASLLAATIAQSGVDVARLSGAGYRDTTRVAAGPSAMWAEILLGNRDEMVAGLREFRTMLDRMLASLETNNHPDVETLLEEGRRARLGVAEESQER
jgi:prephenate dehydrogenase